jgi:hypothetical protein
MTRIRLPCLAVLSLASLLAACGGDSKPPSPPGSAQNPLPAQQEAETGDAAADARTNEGQPAPGHKHTEEPGYQALVERQAAKPRHRFTPCNLVTRAQARAIVGEPLRQPVEAPQGPTCIYRTEAGRSFVTLAVQSLRFDALKRQIRRPQQIEVSSRTAYCGKLGQPMLYVPLASGRVLSVSASCDVARQFAVAAVQRLDS